MLITKFNRMVRNKWVWTFFALLISALFLGYFSPRSGGCGRRAFQEDAKVGAQGKLYDRNVSRDEFVSTRFFEMGFRENMPLTPKGREQLHKRTWQRIAALRAAEQMKITATGDEIAAVIARDPNFLANGVFNRERYRAIVQSKLHIDVETFETYLLQELTIQKLAAMLQSVLLASPLDLQRRLSNLTDSFTVQYAVLKTNTVHATAKLASDDVQKFYAEHKKLFAEPPKVSVKYVAFPISNYVANVHISDSEMKDYYEDRDDEFMSTDTNSTATRLPLNQVTNVIAGRLTRNSAEREAKNAAAELVLKLSDRSDKALGFDQAVAAQGLSVCTSAFITANGKVPGLDVGHDFNKAAFDLDPEDRTRSFSDPIIGSNAVYVLAIRERIDARIPEFAEVKDKAEELAQRSAEQDAFVQRCKAIHHAVREDLKTGKSFSAAAAVAGLQVKTTEPFSAYTGLTNDASYSEELASSIMYLNKGELTELVPTTNGVLMAFVSDRQPGDASNMLMLKPQLQTLVDRYSVGILFRDWEDYLISKGGFEDYAPVKVEEDEKASETEDGESRTESPDAS